MPYDVRTVAASKPPIPDSLHVIDCRSDRRWRLAKRHLTLGKTCFFVGSEKARDRDAAAARYQIQFSHAEFGVGVCSARTHSGFEHPLRPRGSRWLTRRTRSSDGVMDISSVALRGEN